MSDSGATCYFCGEPFGHGATCPVRFERKLRVLESELVMAKEHISVLESRNTITAESVDAESIRVCFDGMDYLFNREAARTLILTLAQHVWPELTDANALRFLANEMLVRENERLVVRNAILERVYRVADRFTDCVAEFPNDPSAWGEYLDALTDAMIEATQPPTTNHQPPSKQTL